jgi:hypothetical protein
LLFADNRRCPPLDDLCRRVHDLEPGLPILPPFDPTHQNLCMVKTPFCLPSVQVISGFHMLDDAALGFLRSLPQLETRSGPPGNGCFDDWETDEGAALWAQGWGDAPVHTSSGDKKLILAHCNKLLSWHPGTAGRYLKACEMRFTQTCANWQLVARAHANDNVVEDEILWGIVALCACTTQNNHILPGSDSSRARALWLLYLALET